jgi:Uri superfamily endonuclease
MPQWMIDKLKEAKRRGDKRQIAKYGKMLQRYKMRTGKSAGRTDRGGSQVADRIKEFEERVQRTLSDTTLPIEQRLWRVDAMAQQHEVAAKSVVDEIVDRAIAKKSAPALPATHGVGDNARADIVPVKDPLKRKKIARALQKVRAKRRGGPDAIDLNQDYFPESGTPKG